MGIISDFFLILGATLGIVGTLLSTRALGMEREAHARTRRQLERINKAILEED